jgi:hypothetical protein
MDCHENTSYFLAMTTETATTTTNDTGLPRNFFKISRNDERLTTTTKDKEQLQLLTTPDCHENTSYFLAMTTETATTKDKDNYNDKINFPICQTSNLLPFASSVLYTFILSL